MWDFMKITSFLWVSFVWCGGCTRELWSSLPILLLHKLKRQNHQNYHYSNKPCTFSKDVILLDDVIYFLCFKNINICKGGFPFSWLAFKSKVVPSIYQMWHDSLKVRQVKISRCIQQIKMRYKQTHLWRNKNLRAQPL